MNSKKTAMIWGASGGIGLALLEHLVTNDWAVAAISREPEKTSQLTPHSFAANVRSDTAVQNAVMETNLAIGEIALWIYAAGDITATPVQKMDPATWQRILDANLNGAFLTTHRSLPLLAEDAHLFYLGAVSERLRLPGLSAYAAAKVGLEAFAEALRKEERKKRITVVRPGAVDTPLWEKVPLRLPKDAATPEKVSARILTAYHEGHSGFLDLV
ncbi:MAG: SDR family NAD(P)-dependent oxidoreductase [Chloroflexi bacterium]|nr:SDR family NAD(P)-dependent oxidoreductase [Chloroflexota bacterium]MBP7041177.1 SDR family NAD(P)-dependent oxidoreductase [Chloroflexota bacterium]